MGVIVPLLVWLFPRPTPPPATVVVPDVVNAEVEEAKGSVVRHGLVPKVISGEERDGPTIVLEQVPEGETRAPAGSQVTLIVSTESTTVTVPDLVGMPQEDANSLLDELGLILQVRGETGDTTVPAGQVLTQQPAPGQDVTVGTRVLITVSKAMPAAQPKISRVSVSETPDGRAEVDITVRNDGTQLAILTGVDFTIISRNSATPSGPLPPSGEYDGVIPTDAEIPSTVPINITHTVDPAGPNAADRFTVTIATDGNLIQSYQFQISVRTSEKTLPWPETFGVSLFGLGMPRQDGSPPGDRLPDKDPAPGPTGQV